MMYKFDPFLKTFIVQSNQTVDWTKNDEAIDHFPPFDVSNINCFFMWFKQPRRMWS